MTPPHNPAYGQDSGTDDPRIVSLFHETPRYVRPLSPEHCARALGDEEMLDAIEQQLRGDLRPVRHITITSRRDRWTRAFGIAVAVFAIVYFGGRLLWGAL